MAWVCMKKEQWRTKKGDGPSLSPDAYARYRNTAPTAQGDAEEILSVSPPHGKALGWRQQLLTFTARCLGQYLVHSNSLINV